MDSNLLRISVECYAGYKGEETPRTLVLGERRVTVKRVLDRWLAPEYRYFKIEGDDGATYIVRYDVTSGSWELTMFHRSEGSG